MVDHPTTLDRDALLTRLAEAEETLRAIRAGEVDAVVVSGEAGDQVFTLRSTDQPYRHLVEQMPQGALMLTLEGDVLYANRRFAMLVNEPLDRVIGGSLVRYLSDHGRDMFTQLAEARAGQCRTTLVTSDGREIDVYLSLTTMVNEDVEQHNVMVADLRELVDAEAGRQRALDESQAKDEFMAMLAHELRNPIGAIASAAQVLQRLLQHADPRVTRASQVIERQVDHLGHLLDDLLNLSRAIMGKITLDRCPVELSTIVQRTVEELAERHPDRVFEQSHAPVWVHADAIRLGQILGNLMSNAVKFTERGGRIQVTLHAEDDDAVLLVRDDGVGMPDDLVPHVFDLFVQGARTTGPARPGLGIGLTLVQRLVILHGGSVSAESTGPGYGSTFTVRLPRLGVPPPAVTPPDDVEGTRVVARVLVVEDNDDVRTMLQMALEMDGHQVIPAGDGAQGLSSTASDSPDIALVDLGLPDMDGYELATRLRARHPRLPLVALSGYGRPVDRKRSADAGFDEHLVKPADPMFLRQTIARLVGTPSTPR